MAAKRKNLVKQGRGNKPNACRVLTSEEEEKLFESGAFGCHNLEALQRTLWRFFSLHFGFRARDESRKLCLGDLELQIDPETGREILVWLAERGSKTRQGLEGSHQRHFNPKIFATGTEQCPVRYFKIFESHRPEEAKTPTSPFFLAINLVQGVASRQKPNRPILAESSQKSCPANLWKETFQPFGTKNKHLSFT